MRRLLLGVVVALLCGTGTAQAATPFSLGPGDTPGVAVGPDGTAYIAFNGPEFTEPQSLHFCRLARGATTCIGAPTIDGAVAYGLGRPFVHLADDGTITVVQTRDGAVTNYNPVVYVFTSGDGGTTWTARPAGSIDLNLGTFAPDGTFLGATDGTGEVQAVPLASGAAANAPVLDPDNGYTGTTGVVSNTQRIAVFTDVIGDAQFWLSGGDPNDPTSWSGPTPIGYASYPRMASGPGGPFMLDSDVNGALEVRQWNGSFPPGAEIAPELSGDASQADLFDDAKGWLHVAFGVYDANGAHLIYATSDNDGVTWSAGTVVTQDDDEESAIALGAAADHDGVAVWQSSGEIRAATIGPDSPLDPLPTPVTYDPGTTPIAAPLVPQFHRTVVLRPQGGTVLYKRAGAKKYVHVTAPQIVPLGATVDVRHGVVKLVAAMHGATQSIKLFDGAFTVAQPGSLTEFTLGACAPRVRQRLWADGTGAFRTRGRYSTATASGGRWLTENTCSETFTRAARGTVSVHDVREHQTLTLHPGQTYKATR